MTKSRIKINEADEEDIQEMIDDMTARGAPTCPYRQRLSWHFGHKATCECHNRVKLKEEFEHWLVNVKPAQRAEEERHKK